VTHARAGGGGGGLSMACQGRTTPRERHRAGSVQPKARRCTATLSRSLEQRLLFASSSNATVQATSLCQPHISQASFFLPNLYLVTCTVTRARLRYTYTLIINYTFLSIWQLVPFYGNYSYNFRLPKLKINSKINK
jgi:hypothetical protein